MFHGKLGFHWCNGFGISQEFKAKSEGKLRKIHIYQNQGRYFRSVYYFDCVTDRRIMFVTVTNKIFPIKLR